MIAYFCRALRSQLRGRTLLYLLAVLGVALGVASVLCIQLLSRSAIDSFAAAVEIAGGGSDLTVVGRSGALPEETLTEVLAQPGVAAAWPVCRAEVAVLGRRGLQLEILGVDVAASAATTPLPGRRDLEGALGRRGWIAVQRELARRQGWRAGDTVEVGHGSRRISLLVGALIDLRRVNPLVSSKLAVMDIAQAQGLLGRGGVLDQIEVRSAPGVEPAALARELVGRLGGIADVLTPAEQREQAASLLRAFRLNLTALSSISLFVGVFLVYSSTQAALARRYPELGLLRSLGTTPLQVLGLILGEAALLGALGVAIGLPLGVFAARANREVVSATVAGVYGLSDVESLVIPVGLLSLGAAIGIGTALLGAIGPAIDISRKDTKVLLSALHLHRRVGGLAGRLCAAGGIVLLAALLWFWLFGRRWQPAGFVLAVALLVGLTLMTPQLVRGLCGRVPLRGFGLGCSLRSIGARLHSSAFAIAALAVSVSMLVGVTLMVGSFRRTVEDWIRTTVRADLYVSSASWRRGSAGAELEPELVAALERWPGIRALDRLRSLTVPAGGRRIALAGVELRAAVPERRFDLLDGEPRAALRALRDHGAALISEPLARKSGLARGDRLVVEGPRGSRAYPIAGVYRDYGTERGAAVIDLAVLERDFGTGPIHSLALYLEPDRDPERIAARLAAAFPEAPLRIRSNRRLRLEALRVFDQTFAITRILQAMSLLIAVCGIALALLVLAQERLAELALYRALGAVRRQTFQVFAGEGLSMALVGLLQGWVGGVLLALVLILVIQRAYFGWSIQLHWPWLELGWQSLMIVAAAALASFYPAWRASQAPAAYLSAENE
jgi:putative ABC transport system permease protein